MVTIFLTDAGRKKDGKLWRLLCFGIGVEDYRKMRLEEEPILPKSYVAKGCETNIQVTAELRKADR